MTNSAQIVSIGSGRSRPLLMGVLVLLWGLAWAAPGWPQVPDNRGVKLDPEDAISPAYAHTLEQRDRQRLGEAQAQGETFISTFHGTGEAPAVQPPAVLPDVDEEWANTAPVQDPAPRRPLPVYESGAAGRRGRGERRRPGGDGGGAARELDASPRRSRVCATEPRSRAPPMSRRTPERRVHLERRAPMGRFCRSGRATASMHARSTRSIPTIPGPWCWSCFSRRLQARWRTGGFERVRQRLVLRLSSLTWKGRTFPVEAWAVDPKCACYGIEGEVDRHFVSRVLLPAAARFAEGFLNAVAMPARTLTIEDGTVFHERAEAGTEEALYAGAAAATRTLGDILMGDGPRETTVRIPRNTPLVVMVARHVAATPGESR